MNCSKQATLSMVLAACILSCQDPSGVAPAPGQPTPVRDVSSQLYIEVSMLGGLDYFYDHKMGMEMAGKALGVRTEYVGPAEYDMAAMVTAFEQAIAKRPAGLVVVGFEPSLNALVDKAVDRGIPVVTVDADLPGSRRIAFVGTGNRQAGLAGGRKLAEMLGTGQVAIMTKPGQSNLEERVQGYRDAFAEHPGIEIVQVVDTQSDPNVAASAAAAMLQKFPDLAAIACVEAAGGSGAAMAVKEAGKAGLVKIIAMDRDNAVLEQIKRGVISATVVQQTALMPFYAVQILYNLNNHSLPITTDNRLARVSGVPAVVDTGVVLVDASNCEFFMRKQ
ncbi:substrate-binding domain-containing protein [bacterium]|nr:substrate-binding domain-containing protein [bacterium]